MVRSSGSILFTDTLSGSATDVWP